jgi:hypothetical protein
MYFLVCVTGDIVFSNCVGKMDLDFLINQGEKCKNENLKIHTLDFY